MNENLRTYHKSVKDNTIDTRVKGDKNQHFQMKQ